MTKHARTRAEKNQLATLWLLMTCACGGAGSGALPADKLLFRGMCDASGAVPWSAHSFAVADDEDNVIRVYDTRPSGARADEGAPTHSFHLGPELDLPRKRKGEPETDIEGAARAGSLAYWITSHGRSSSGKSRPERHRFFATEIVADGTALRVVGSAYQTLLRDLIADPRYAALGLEVASGIAPKREGGLNIEGLSTRAEGGLFVGFRSPVPGGKALLATLLNPEPVVHGREPARFGPPLFLALGGLGIRDITWWRGRYLILAGHADGGQPSRLYTWDGKTTPRRIERDLEDLNPEGFFSPEGSDRVMLLSDDGTRELDGVECKELDDPSRRRFRALWVTPGDAR